MKALFLSLLLAGLFFTQSCSKNDDDSNSNQVQTQAVTAGSWKVSLFTDSGNDETTDFSGYSFQFNSNGSVSATKNSTFKSGTWSLNSGSKKFVIDLGAKIDSNKPLGELTDDWHIIFISLNEIKLSDDNTPSLEFLTFTKN